MRLTNDKPSDAVLSVAAPQLDSLKKASDGIEGMFVKTLLTEMEKNTQKTMFGNSPGAGVYQDLMNQEFAKHIASSGSLGISKMFYNQLSPAILAQAEATVKLASAAPSAKAQASASGSASPAGTIKLLAPKDSKLNTQP